MVPLSNYIMADPSVSLHHLPTNWLYNFVRRQELKYFGHVTWHNRDDNNESNGSREKKHRKSKTKIGKDIIDIVATMATATRVAENRHQFRTKIFGQRRPEEDMLHEEEACTGLEIRVVLWPQSTKTSVGPPDISMWWSTENF